jgi:hypothetical protein
MLTLLDAKAGFRFGGARACTSTPNSLGTRERADEADHAIGRAATGGAKI